MALKLGRRYTSQPQSQFSALAEPSSWQVWDIWALSVGRMTTIDDILVLIFHCSIMEGTQSIRMSKATAVSFLEAH